MSGNPVFESVLGSLTDRQREQVEAAYALLEHGREPVHRQELPALQDPTARDRLEELLRRTGRVLVPVDGVRFTSGYVSFLSTSVRASLTANLLAQPLNELTPERIFDAIGTLTGLNREIDDEQKARQHALDAQRANLEYEEWNQRVTVTEDMIGARERARSLKAEALSAWRSRCARSLVDGVALDDDLAHDLARLEGRGEELSAEIETADDNLARLTDDKTFEGATPSGSRSTTTCRPR
jgi:hypothetical protein